MNSALIGENVLESIEFQDIDRDGLEIDHKSATVI